MKSIELLIDKIAFGGDGLSTVNGKTCFVEGALPGEKVIAEVLQDKKNFLKTKTAKILQRSPFRIDPPCVHIAYCGGCQYQHVIYSEELKLKEAQIKEIFQRSLNVDPSLIQSIVYSDQDYRYRNGITLHRTVPNDKELQRLGFIGRDNISKVVIKDCQIADPRFALLYQKKWKMKKNLEKISFKLSEKGEIFSDQDDTFLRIRIGNELLLTHSRGFFQNNLKVSELLVKKMREWIDRSACHTFFDLYAGVGTFSILSATSAIKIYCIEENPYSIHALRMNKEERKLTHMEIISGRVEKAFRSVFEKEKNSKSLIFLDPPRQGIDLSLANYFSGEAVPEYLIYLSCDPLTLVRDLKIILTKGCYEFECVAPFDMFPRTKHIEIAVLLKKKSASVV